MTIDFEGRVPLYLQLAAILRGQIESGEYAAGRRLPSKADLRHTYQVSQGTVEHALALLRDEGLVETVMGKGQYVIPPEERGNPPGGS